MVKSANSDRPDRQILVSIIVTSYNYKKYIERCIRSCLDQKMPEGSFEVIVVDDCSGDGTQELLASLKNHNNFRYEVNEENMGVAGAANTGIRMARGQFVVRVDADDIVSPDFVRRLSKYLLDREDVFCVSCDYHYANEQGEKVAKRSAKDHPISCGIMYRKHILVESGLYDCEWRHREEEELRRRMGERYKIHHLGEALYQYVLHDNNKTKQVLQMEAYRQRLSPGNC